MLGTFHLWKAAWAQVRVWGRAPDLDAQDVRVDCSVRVGSCESTGLQGAGASCPGGVAIRVQGTWLCRSWQVPLSWQVMEERQRLWLSELKRLYVERLHEVAQKAERSERNLQLQLFMAQQEQRRLRKELQAQQGLGPEPRTASSTHAEADPGVRPEEEARWEVSDSLGLP